MAPKYMSFVEDHLDHLWMTRDGCSDEIGFFSVTVTLRSCAVLPATDTDSATAHLSAGTITTTKITKTTRARKSGGLDRPMSHENETGASTQFRPNGHQTGHTKSGQVQGIKGTNC